MDQLAWLSILDILKIYFYKTVCILISGMYKKSYLYFQFSFYLFFQVRWSLKFMELVCGCRLPIWRSILATGLYKPTNVGNWLLYEKKLTDSRSLFVMGWWPKNSWNCLPKYIHKTDRFDASVKFKISHWINLWNHSNQTIQLKCK